VAGHELFLYGTLRDPALLAVVLGEAPGPLEPARLPGHAAMQVAGDSYPVIVADPCATADGLLLRGVGPDGACPARLL
jgi:ADP-ribose pyrophosphatase